MPHGEIMSQKCIFCQIISGEKPAEFVYKNESIVAFRDIKPHAPIHILIVPRKHIRSINDLQDEDRSIVADLIFKAKEIARDLEFASDGYKLVFNTESGGGQFVFHLHLHLVGGWK